MQEAVDTPELLGRLDPRRTPPQDHLAVRQRLTLLEWSRQISSIDSMTLVARWVRASVGGTPSWLTVSVSASPSRRLADAPGVLGQAAGEGFESGVGGERVGVVVGGVHLLGHRRRQVLR